MIEISQTRTGSTETGTDQDQEGRGQDRGQGNVRTIDQVGTRTESRILAAGTELLEAEIGNPGAVIAKQGAGIEVERGRR